LSLVLLRPFVLAENRCNEPWNTCDALGALPLGLLWLLIQAIMLVPLALALVLFAVSVVKRRSSLAAFGIAVAALNLALILRPDISLVPFT
jgi:hypothetical protein